MEIALVSVGTIIVLRFLKSLLATSDQIDRIIDEEVPRPTQVYHNGIPIRK